MNFFIETVGWLIQTIQCLKLFLVWHFAYALLFDEEFMRDLVIQGSRGRLMTTSYLYFDVHHKNVLSVGPSSVKSGVSIN